MAAINTDAWDGARMMLRTGAAATLSHSSSAFAPFQSAASHSRKRPARRSALCFAAINMAGNVLQPSGSASVAGVWRIGGYVSSGLAGWYVEKGCC